MRAAFKSKSKNTPFDGWTLKGGVAATIVGGRVVYLNERIAGTHALRDAVRRERDPRQGAE